MIIYDNYRYCAQIIATQFRTTWNLKCSVIIVTKFVSNFIISTFLHVYNDTRSYRGLPTTYKASESTQSAMRSQLSS
jgi:hypothetical protein